MELPDFFDRMDPRLRGFGSQVLRNYTKNDASAMPSSRAAGLPGIKKSCDTYMYLHLRLSAGINMTLTLRFYPVESVIQAALQ